VPSRKLRPTLVALATIEKGIPAVARSPETIAAVPGIYIVAPSPTTAIRMPSSRWPDVPEGVRRGQGLASGRPGAGSSSPPKGHAGAAGDARPVC